MFQIENQIISLDLIEKHFFCDLKKCRGICCLEGESGAPLEENEIKILEKIFPKIKNYLTEESKEIIEKKGIWVIDEDGDKVTPLINKLECVYTIFENGIIKCAIEKAFLEGKTDFKKPISCYLYPLRITEYKNFDAVNYETWDICKHAIKLGKKKNIKVFQFLKEAIILKYGKNWYDELKLFNENYKKEILK